MSGAQGLPQGQPGGAPGIVPPTPVLTQLHTTLGNVTQPGTPGVGSNATPPGGQGNQPGQINPGQQGTQAGSGGMGATDLQALRELVGGGVRMPDMRAVPKIKCKDANLEGIIKYIKLQRYYMQAQHGRADPLTDERFSNKLP